MAKKSKKSRSAKSSSKSGVSAGGALKAVAGKAKSAVFGGGAAATGKTRRSRGPNYWANKVIVEKLKKKYRALKYGSVR